MPIRIEKGGEGYKTFTRCGLLQHGLALHLLHREWHNISHFLFPKQLEYMNLRRDITFYNKNQASTDNYLVCIPYLTNHKASFHRLCSSNTKKPSHLLKSISRAAFQHSNSHCLNTSPGNPWHLPSKILMHVRSSYPCPVGLPESEQCLEHQAERGLTEQGQGRVPFCHWQ